MARRPSRHYVNNRDFYDALVKYRKELQEAEASGKELPKIPDYIGECIFEIAQRLGHRSNFSGYSFLNDMRGDAVENCLKYLDKFDPERGSNPFAYFTQICWYAFLRRIESEKKQVYIKHKVTENEYLHDSLVNRGLFSDYGDKTIHLDDDYISNFVEDYENKLEEKKVKKNESSSDK